MLSIVAIIDVRIKIEINSERVRESPGDEKESSRAVLRAVLNEAI
jgi:hypothetical protein